MLGAVALYASPMALAGANSGDRELGQYPLCEASAATLVRCPDGNGSCVAVADNERERQLYLFRLGRDRIEFDQSVRLVDASSGKNLRIGDLEALMSINDSTVIAFGSHSRASRCKTKNKRRRVGIVTISAVDAPTTLLPGLDLDCASTVHDWRVLSVCAHLRAVRQAAEDIASQTTDTKQDKKRAKTQCARLTPLNIEGAVQFRSQQWIGLRAPLMMDDSGRRDLAVMLRLALPETSQVEDAALLDLGGLGIRALSHDANWIYGIAGPATKATGAFRLFRFAADRLSGPHPIKVEFLSQLPDSAEGLVIDDGNAVVIIDGGVDHFSKTCSKPARYRFLRVTP